MYYYHIIIEFFKTINTVIIRGAGHVGRAKCPMGLATVTARIRPSSKTTPNGWPRGGWLRTRAPATGPFSLAAPTHHVSFSSRERERRPTPSITVRILCYTFKVKIT